MTSHIDFASAYGAANNGDTLEFDDGEYSIAEFVLAKSLTLRAKNRSKVIIKGADLNGTSNAVDVNEHPKLTRLCI